MGPTKKKPKAKVEEAVEDVAEVNVTKPGKSKSKEGKASKTGQNKSKEGDAVDDLFAEGDAFWNADEDVAESDAAGSEVLNDESSEGAFEAPDDGEMPFDDLDDEDLDQVGLGAKHEQELAAIKERDPEFYKFLVENDQQLLHFRGPAEAGKEEQEDDEEAKEKPMQQGVLTLERWKRITASAPESFTAFKFALNAYHMAVRSTQQEDANQESAEPSRPQEDSDDDGDQGKKLTRKDRQAKRRKEEESKAAAAKEKVRQKRGLLRIDDEATFSAVLEWCISNWVPLLKHFAGKVLQPKDRKTDIDLRYDPTLREKWPRVKVMSQIFWEETYFLINHLRDPTMLDFVLRSLSGGESLAFLWPFKSVRQRFLKCCCSLWSTSSAHPVRLVAFLFVRNAAAMSMHAPDLGATPDIPHLEAITRMVLKSFADVASWGYSWRSLSTFRFMENCVVELLKIDDDTAYRVGYVWIRQLALILRSSSIATSQGAGAKEGSKKSGKRRAAQRNAMSQMGWPFVRSLYLWTKCIGSLPSLELLAYPLSTIAIGALRSRLASVQTLPFAYHCIRCLNKMSAAKNIFVPAAFHIIRGFETLLKAMEKAHKKNRKAAPGEKAGQSLSATKAPDFEVLLRLAEGQLTEMPTLDATASSLCLLLVDHLGLVSRSPSFPELTALLRQQLRKIRKECTHSEPLRRQLKVILDAAAETDADLIERRKELGEDPKAEARLQKFFVFDETTPLAKVRIEALISRAAEEQQRVEMETSKEDKDEAKKREKVLTDDMIETKKERKRRKRQEQRVAKGKAKHEAAQQADIDTVAKRQRLAVRKAELAKAPAPRGQDTLEEMDFSE